VVSAQWRRSGQHPGYGRVGLLFEVLAPDPVRAISCFMSTHPATPKPTAPADKAKADTTPQPTAPSQPQREIGGPAGPEPTRYGDWESKGRCTDF